MSNDLNTPLADKQVANAATGLVLAREIVSNDSLTKAGKVRDVYRLFRNKTLSFAVAEKLAQNLFALSFRSAFFS